MGRTVWSLRGFEVWVSTKVVREPVLPAGLGAPCSRADGKEPVVSRQDPGKPQALCFPASFVLPCFSGRAVVPNVFVVASEFSFPMKPALSWDRWAAPFRGP